LSIRESNGDATQRNFANQLISDVGRIEGGSLPSKNYGMARKIFRCGRRKLWAPSNACASFAGTSGSALEWLDLT
jgi:hypothetical protein